MSLASAAMGQNIGRTRYTISEADVVKELYSDGLTVETSQVHIPLQMNATITSPKLEIITAAPVGDKHVRLELRCPTVAECLPFFATVDINNASVIATEIRSKPDWAAAVSHQAPEPIGGDAMTRPQVRVGSHVVLKIRDGHLDIHLQVLAVDTGKIGQLVRVCTLDRKKMFRATVTGDGTVTGVME